MCLRIRISTRVAIFFHTSLLREACYPAISCAMELLQRERPSKLASGSSFTRFPDKAYTRWNGASPFLRLDEEALAVRHEVPDLTQHLPSRA